MTVEPILIPFMAQDHAFKIEEWQGPHILQVLAGADNLLIAKAAYREAVTHYPKSTHPTPRHSGD